MRDFLRSKFFTVTVIVALIMVIVPTVFNSMGIGGMLKNAINTVLSPAQNFFTYCTDAVDGFSSFFTEFDRIVDENNALREEISALRDQVKKAEEAEEMNEWLYDYLELKREHTDYKFTEADITGSGGGNFITVLTLDKGTAHGIEKNMPVVSSEGIVGYITEVGTNWSKAVTLLESGNAVGAYVERSGEMGVIEGSFALAKEGVCLMEYMGADADIRVGDRIISAGYGSVYPRGLVIGTVESVEKDADGRDLRVVVRPGTDLANATKLMIVTDYETYTEE